MKFKLICITIIFLLVIPMKGVPSFVATGIKSSGDQKGVCSPNDEPTTRIGDVGTRTYDWNDPSFKQVQGDSFNERAIFVHQEDGTYLDDMLYVAAIPAAVHWQRLHN